MAKVEPLRGIHYNPEVAKFGKALAPPYDVIDKVTQERLYGRYLRNIVRIDFGKDVEGDTPGSNDRYTRSAQHLESWLGLGVLQQDEHPSFYVTEHEYEGSDGGRHVRRGIYGRVLALPWEQSEVRPHERTMRGPKEDRMRLMEATKAQTSAVFMVWRDGSPDLERLLERICADPPLLEGESKDEEIGETEGDIHRVWRVDDPQLVEAIRDAFATSTLYIADGHHRYETAAAYATKQRENNGSNRGDSDYTLAYICSAESDGIELQPTHRMVSGLSSRPASGLELAARTGSGWDWVPTDDFDGAIKASRLRSGGFHAFAVKLGNENGMLLRKRREAESPRENLDVVVLEQEVFSPLGISGDNVTYTRDSEYVDGAVRSGNAEIGFVLNSMPVADVIAVADAGEIMPQKSTYFYPKVPTGEVISPL